MKYITNKIFFIFFFVILGCNPHTWLLPSFYAVQYYKNPNRFLVIGKNSAEPDSTWKTPYCPYISDAKVYYLNIGDTIGLLNNFHIVPDSAFNILDNDILYSIARLKGVNIHTLPDEKNCYYLSDHLYDSNGYRFHQTRYIDIYIINGIIKKVKIFFWAT